jgi:hypothetical protein
LIVLASDAIARAWLGPVRANPDMLGYLAPSYMALGTLAASCLGTLAWSWKDRHRRSWFVVRRGAFLVPLCALLLIPETSVRASLAAFTATDALDDLRIRQLPPRAVVLESSPQTVFRSVELSAVEGARPDLVRVPLPFLRYPNAAAHLLAGQPGLAPLVHGYLRDHDRLRDVGALSALASARPVFVELDTRIDPTLYPLLSPHGVYAQVGSARTQPKLEDFYAVLNSRLGAQQRESETARQLLWIHYMNAVLLGASGQAELAREALAHAYELQPTEQRLPALRDALNADAPLDASAFLKF